MSRNLKVRTPLKGAVAVSPSRLIGPRHPDLSVSPITPPPPPFLFHLLSHISCWKFLSPCSFLGFARSSRNHPSIKSQICCSVGANKQLLLPLSVQDAGLRRRPTLSEFSSGWIQQSYNRPLWGTTHTFISEHDLFI